MGRLEQIEKELADLGGDKLPEIKAGKSSPSGFVPSQTALAAAIGVSREAIRLWKREPGNPGLTKDRRYDVAAWDEWASKRGDQGNVAGEKKADWEIKRLKIMCERLQFEMEITKGNYSLNSDIERWVSDVVTNMKSLLLQMPSKLAPQVVALEDPAEAEAMIRKEIDDALTKLHEGSWDKS